MPRNSRRRQNRPQARNSEGTAPTKANQRRPQGRRVASSARPWYKRSTLRSVGIFGAVIGIVALVAVGVRASSGDDFEFSMYQGRDMLPVNELNYSRLFPAEKPVVLSFWAGLCPVCRVDMPHFQAVYDQSEDDFIFLGLDIGPFVGLGSHQDARNLLRELNITYPAGYAHNSRPMRKFGITGTPTTVFLTPDGKVFRKWAGFLSQGQMTSIIQDLLRASSASSQEMERKPVPGASQEITRRPCPCWTNRWPSPTSWA